MIEREIASSPADVVVVDAVKLIESGLAERCDAIWVVTARRAQQLQRLIERRGMSEQDARQRVRAQSSQAAKVRHADVVIDNSGSLERTEKQVHRAWARIPRPL